MDIRLHDKTGNYVSLEDCIQDMQSTIITLQATIVQLEYKLEQSQPKSEETPKSDYDKLKEEIIEEVNLIISDLL